MAVLNYTSYEDVRAALGVTENELSDDTLTLDLYEAHLMSDLEDISIDLDPLHLSLIDGTSLTDAQRRFMRVANAFATYSVAKALTATLPMFGPKSVEDGKAKIDRFNDPYKDTVRAVLAEWEKWKQRLADAFFAVTSGSSTTTARVMFSVAVPTSDPVTGT
jgi:hypothetical protein